MITHFLTSEFSLTDLPVGVAQHHCDNFECALRQRQAAQDALQDAQDLQRDLGPAPRAAARNRLQDAWAWYHEEQATYESMVQDATEKLIDDYPYGFSES